MIPRHSGRGSAVRRGIVFILGLQALFLLTTSACSFNLGQRQTIPMFEQEQTPPSPPQSSDPPAAIQQVVAYRFKSEGIIVYLVLEDRAGKQTTSMGYVSLVIKDRDTGQVLYRTSRTVQSSDFVETQVGTGLFAERRLVYSFDLIPYEQFSYQPKDKDSIIQVDVAFSRTGGSTLRGTTLVTR